MNAQGTIKMPLRRRRIGELITAALTKGAIALLIAPPGYGKTTALQQTLGSDASVRWLELPPCSRLEDVVRLLTEVVVPDHIASIATLFTGSGHPQDFERIVEWMARRLQGFRGTIVIDHLHRCFGDQDAVAFLAHLLELTAFELHWAAASREVPSFPIGTWVARGLMALPITDDELALDLDEAVELAAGLGVKIEREVLAAVVDDSQGWPMAVHLALQLWDRTRSIAPLHIRTREVLFSQIESELWPHLKPKLREIIVACALLPEVSGSVLEAAGFREAESLLDQAHNAMPFVQRTVEGGYALHDLFAEFILTTIRRDVARLASLRDRLASGLLASERPAEALQVLVAGQDSVRILAVLAQAGFRLIELGHRSIVADALAFLSTTGKRNDPIVAALRGVLSHADGGNSSAEALYAYAYERGLPPALRVETGRRLATAYVNRGEGTLAVAILEPLVNDQTIPHADRVELRSSLAAALATAARREDANRVIEEILAQIESVAPDGQARILQRLGFTTFYMGDLERAETFARDASQLAVNLHMWYYVALAQSVLYSVTSLTESDATIALGHARLTFSAGERAGDNGLAAFGLRAEYVLQAYRGDASAFDDTESQLSHYHDVRTFRSSFAARSARALADALRGHVPKSISTLTAIDVRQLSGAERALRESMLALFYFLADRPVESAALLKAPLLLEASGNFVSRRYANLARVTRGMALWSHDRTAQARRMLRFADDVGAENDRILVQCVVKLCSTSRQLVPEAVVTSSLARLKAHGWGGYGRLFEMILDKNESVSSLSPAEIKTLRAFANGANTLQVADDLGKSPHTIEAQLKSAYKKIGCVSRAEALAYARSRGWLDERRWDIPETC